MQISLHDALDTLQNGKLFSGVFEKQGISVEIYKPVGADQQQSHTRDELYFIASGKGYFYHNGQTLAFAPGDFLFVPAGDEHRFEKFSEDFSTWVVFFGPTNP
jgi:mannose-6-phosphate isomerase-like protein (cupin superfamily)